MNSADKLREKASKLRDLIFESASLDLTDHTLVELRKATLREAERETSWLK